MAIMVIAGIGSPLPALASEIKAISASATGQVVSQSVCGAATVCQTATVSGNATHIGRLTGILHEQVNLVTGEYLGAAIFTTPNGDTFSTDYVGQIIASGPDGSATFVESHQITDGTGRFQGATGGFEVIGTADAFHAIAIEATGTLTR